MQRFREKKDGTLRVTSDFRALNSMTVTDTYPIEEVRATLDWMGTKTIFSTFDLKDGFFRSNWRRVHETLQLLTRLSGYFATFVFPKE